MNGCQGDGMIIKGKYKQARVFNKNIDDLTKGQIKNYLDMDYCQGEQIRIMPDTHAGSVVKSTLNGPRLPIETLRKSSRLLVTR